MGKGESEGGGNEVKVKWNGNEKGESECGKYNGNKCEKWKGNGIRENINGGWFRK